MTPRDRIDTDTYLCETTLVHALTEQAMFSTEKRANIAAQGAQWVEAIRNGSKPALVDVFLAEYGLSNDEGVALMCLTEALLRVPDDETINTLIADKIGSSDWAAHLGASSSPLVHASSWGLLLTGKLLNTGSPDPAGYLKTAIKRLGKPAIRAVVARVMKEMGRQFVLGETIEKAIVRAKKQEQRRFRYSYDMLGEAARSESDALCYLQAY